MFSPDNSPIENNLNIGTNWGKEIVKLYFIGQIGKIIETVKIRFDLFEYRIDMEDSGAKIGKSIIQQNSTKLQLYVFVH